MSMLKYIAHGYIYVNSARHVARAIAISYNNLMKSIVTIRLENFRRLLAKHKQAEIARLMGRGPGQVQQWAAKAMGRDTKGSRNIDDDSARLIEKALGLPENWMDQDHDALAASVVEPVALTDPNRPIICHDEEPLDDNEFVVPALNVEVGAGYRIHTEPIKEKRRYRYSKDWARSYGLNPKKLFRFRVRGTSMEPLIKDGSWILVEMGYTNVCDGNLYLLRYGDQVSVKFLFKRYDHGLIVRSFNPSEPDVVVPATDLEHVEVLGRVVETINMWVKRIR
jgi:phage repressor protein C with HTH and peptisase S24 domain